MAFGPSLWMRSQEMVEHVEQGENMLLIITRLASADVTDNHVTDFCSAMRLVHEILSKCGSSDFWQMLVLRNGKHLTFGQSTKCRAVLEGNHETPRIWRRISASGTLLLLVSDDTNLLPLRGQGIKQRRGVSSPI
jgi:hypothetical protein